MEQNNRETLLLEYEAALDRINHFATLRFSALGAGVTLIAVFISVSKDADPIRQIIYSIIVSLLASATIRMVGALSRATYIFENHANWITKQLDVLSFSVVLPHYLRITEKDSATHTFVIASRIVNLLSFLYVFVNGLNLMLMTELRTWLKITHGLVICYSIIVYAISEVYIWAKMRAQKIIEEIGSNMTKAREEALKEMRGNQ